MSLPSDSSLTPQQPNADVAAMPYERARAELVRVVDRLESGEVPLDDALTLWERGEALAARCQTWLDDARTRLDAVAQPADANQAGAPR